jgi:hypothetical protein
MAMAASSVAFSGAVSSFKGVGFVSKCNSSILEHRRPNE